ncbi:MAG: clan AA aspartic protease [Chloroflexi bacterium]|nr:clan AA aspartic protease [Chloroflexota bacterium]
MIEGTVNAAYEAALILSVHGPEGRTREIEAVVDTGYDGFLTLPAVLVGELDLPFVTSGEATLADGSAVSFDIHMVTVDWDGHARHVEADAAETTPLVGMRLLDGHRLYVEVKDGGRVVIETTE